MEILFVRCRQEMTPHTFIYSANSDAVHWTWRLSETESDVTVG